MDVIEILIKAKDMTSPGLGAAQAGSAKAARAIEEANVKAATAIEAANVKAAATVEKANAELAASIKANADKAAAGDIKAAEAMQRANVKAADTTEKAYAEAAAATERANATAARASVAASEESSTKIRDTMKKAGEAGAVALAAIGYESVKMAATFQKEMIKLDTQAGVPKAAIAGLSKGVLDLAGSIGADPDSLAESLYHVESNFKSLGISSPKALQLVKTAAEGAKVGGADLVDVTNALTAAVAANIPGVENLDQAMGYLNATVGAGDMNMQDLAQAFGTGAVAVVKGYGLSIRDVGAALAVFGDNNIRGAKAGTQLRMAVQSLAVPAAAGAKELKSLGMTSDQMAKDMQHGGLLQALQDLKDHLDKAGVSAKQQGAIVTDIFGKKAGTGVAILLAQFDRLSSKYEELDKGAKGFGKSWAETQKTTAQQWDEMKGHADALMIELGSKLLPVLNKVMAWFLSHPGAIQAVGVAILGVAAAFTAMGLAMMANPVSLTVLGLVLLGAALVKLWTTSQKARDIMSTVFAVMADVVITNFQAMVDGAHMMTDGVLNAIEMVEKGIALIPGPTQKAAQEMLKQFQNFKAGVDSTFNAVSGKLSQYKSAVDKLPKTIKLQGNITDLQSKLAAAQAQLKKTVDPAERVRIEGDISRLQAALARARAELNGLPKSKTVTIKTINSTVWVTSGRATGQGGGGGQAHGGVVGSAATGGARSGWTMVGEMGRELVKMSPGSQVYPHGATESMMAGGGRGGPVTIEIHSGGTKLDDLLVQVLRKSIRAKGGNVQVVLGRS